MNVHFFEYLMIMPYTIDTWKLHFLFLRKLDYNLRQNSKKFKPGYKGDHFKPCSKSSTSYNYSSYSVAARADRTVTSFSLIWTVRDCKQKNDGPVAVVEWLL